MKCNECQEKLTDLLHNQLSKNEAQRMNAHLHECRTCYEDYLSLKTMHHRFSEENDVHVPEGWLGRLEDNVEKRRQNAQGSWVSKKWASAAAVILASFVFVATAMATDGFRDFTAFWQDMAQSEREARDDMVEQGYGFKVNEQVVDEDISVTITHVIADEFQTVVYYEIEDLAGERQLNPVISPGGTEILNRDELWETNEYNTNDAGSYFSFLPEESGMNEGKLTFPAISEQIGELELVLKQFQFTEETDDEQLNPFGTSPEIIEGNWAFTLPVEKISTDSVELGDQEHTVNGHRYVFHSLEVGPTMSQLVYTTHLEQQREDGSRPVYAPVNEIEVNGKTYEEAMFGAGAMEGGGDGGASRSHQPFASFYGEDVQSLEVSFAMEAAEYSEPESYSFTVGDIPHVIEYKGHEIAFTDLEEENGEVVLRSEEEIDQNRSYEQLNAMIEIDGLTSRGSSVLPAVLGEDGENYGHEAFFQLAEIPGARIFSHKTYYRLEKEDGTEIGDDTQVHIDIRGHVSHRSFNESVTLEVGND